MNKEKYRLELAALEHAARKEDDELLVSRLLAAGFDAPAEVLGDQPLEASFMLSAWATFTRLKAEGWFKRRPFSAPRFVATYNLPVAERGPDHELHLALALTIDLDYYQNDTVWKPAALHAAAETDGEQAWCRFFDELNATPTTDAAHPEKRTRNCTESVDITKVTLSEVEAASVMGMSCRWLSEKRVKGKIPARLYRQRCEGGKVVYITKMLLLWLEEPGNELFNPGRRKR